MKTLRISLLAALTISSASAQTQSPRQIAEIAVGRYGSEWKDIRNQFEFQGYSSNPAPAYYTASEWGVMIGPHENLPTGAVKLKWSRASSSSDKVWVLWTTESEYSNGGPKAQFRFCRFDDVMAMNEEAWKTLASQNKIEKLYAETKNGLDSIFTPTVAASLQSPDVLPYFRLEFVKSACYAVYDQLHRAPGNLLTLENLRETNKLFDLFSSELDNAPSSLPYYQHYLNEYMGLRLAWAQRALLHIPDVLKPSLQAGDFTSPTARNIFQSTILSLHQRAKSEGYLDLIRKADVRTCPTFIENEPRVEVLPLIENTETGEINIAAFSNIVSRTYSLAARKVPRPQGSSSTFYAPILATN